MRVADNGDGVDAAWSTIASTTSSSMFRNIADCQYTRLPGAFAASSICCAAVYGIGCTMSATGGPNVRSGRKSASPSSVGP